MIKNGSSDSESILNDDNIDELTQMFSDIKLQDNTITTNENENFNEINSLKRNRKRKGKLPRQAFKPKYESTNFYYPRPTPQDILLEEKGDYQNCYQNGAIYEWDIDGMVYYQVIKTLHKI